MKFVQKLITCGLLMVLPVLTGAKQPGNLPGLHISQHDIKDESLRLNTQWAFYWQTFHNPEIFENDSIPKPDDYSNAPCPWNMKSENGRQFPRFGYGTYFLRVYVPQSKHSYSLKIRGLSSASTCYVNGEKVAQIGSPADNPQDARPDYNMVIAELPAHEKSDSSAVYNIVFHVSNYSHHLGGMWDIIEFGRRETISENYHKSIFWEMLVAGVFIMMIAYHLIIFVLNPSGKPYLWFAMFVFFLLIRTLLTEEVFIKFAFPDISYGLMFRISYIATFSIVICLLGFFNSILPSENNKFAFRILMGLMAGVVITILLAPMHVYTSMNLLFLILTGMVFLYLIFHVMGMAIVHRKRGVWILLLAIIPGFVGFVNDAMYSLEIIHTAYIAHIGSLIFVVFQSWYLAREFVFVYRDNYRLAKQLQDVNENLETLVKDRTHALVDKQAELEKEKRILSDINEDLKNAQAFQKKASRMIVHDLKGPLGMIIQITSEPEVKDNELMLMIGQSAMQMQQLVLNLLDVSRMESKQFRIELKQRTVEPVVNFAISASQRLAEGKNISFRFEKHTDLPACFDEQLLKRMICNLLNNSIKYSDEGDTVVVSIDNAELHDMPALLISVSDHGPGVSDDIKNVLFNMGTSERSPWESHGLGLHFCKLAVDAMNGVIYLDTDYTEGARFNVVLPLTCDD